MDSHELKALSTDDYDPFFELFSVLRKELNEFMTTEIAVCSQDRAQTETVVSQKATVKSK